MNSEDHALGVELQLIELVEKQRRARAQHRDRDAEAVQAEIDILQTELAAVVELIGQVGSRPAFHDSVAVEPPPA